MKRFYKAAGVSPVDGGYGVVLDGRAVRTPAGGPTVLPTKAAAGLLAAEWESQGETVKPHTMPLTRLVNVALDRTPDVREGVADEIARYAETDALCHLAEAPQALTERQEAEWTPIRQWAADDLGVRLDAVCGVLASEQPAPSLDRLRALALDMDDVRLTALAHGAALLGSALLIMAIERGRLSAPEAWRLSALEAEWQQTQWGVDEDAAKRAETAKREVEAVGALFSALAA